MVHIDPLSKASFTHRFPETRRWCDDTEFVVLFTPTSHRMTFVVVEILGWDENGAPLFGEDIYNSSPDPTCGTALVHGSVRWDGCSDFDVGDPGELSYRHHYCDADSAGAIGRAIAKVYELAAQHIGEWLE